MITSTQLGSTGANKPKHRYLVGPHQVIITILILPVTARLQGIYILKNKPGTTLHTETLIWNYTE